MIRGLLRLALFGACALALSGCVTLLPKSKPVTLYRFGQPQVATAAVAARTVGVYRTNGTFQTEAGGDKILTIDNGRAAYIAENRWVASAAVLFDEAVEHAFDAAPGHTRLIARGEQGKAAYAIRLDVRNFEARYDQGEKAAPDIVVSVRAALSRSDQTNVGDQVFDAHVRAADNRVTAIVAAYDKALAEVLSQIVAWTNARAT
jgi:cholesterol transport system auxiliary component